MMTTQRLSLPLALLCSASFLFSQACFDADPTIIPAGHAMSSRPLPNSGPHSTRPVLDLPQAYSSGYQSEADSDVDPAILQQGQELWNGLTDAEREQAVADFSRLVTPHIEGALEDAFEDAQGAFTYAPRAPAPVNRHMWASAHDTGTEGTYRSGDIWVSLGSLSASLYDDTAATDTDGDRLSDVLEEQLATGFNPLYHVSGGEYDTVGFAEFYDFVPQTVRDTYGSTPVRLKYRVRPLGIGTKPGTTTKYGYIQADFLTLWNRDCGLPFLCNLPKDLLGIEVDLFLAGHPLDNEWSSMLLAAPAVIVPQSTDYTYNQDPFTYKAYYLRTSAHEDKGYFDRTMWWEYEDGGLPFGFHTNLWLARHKHPTYAFNPDNLPLLRVWFPPIAALLGWLWTQYDWPRWLYFVCYYILYLYIFTCIAEDFREQGSQVGQFPTNVGELSQPAAGMRYIQDPDELAQKLAKDIWSWLLPPLTAPQSR